MISNPEPVRFLSTIRGENGFGFFRYAYDIAFPENWHPLKQIFSLARQMGCTVLLEEEGKPNELGQAEIEQLRSLKPGRPKLQRSITRVSFYTLPVDLARQFKSDFETARGRVSKDLARFKAWYSDTTRNSAVPPENSCLGYLILYKCYHHG